jgi:hypothetical protein
MVGASLVLTASILSTPSASADPGRCGVSVSGPDTTGGSYAYWVRNRCSTTLKFKVHLYTFNRNTNCFWILPGVTEAMYSNIPDGSWQAIGC